MKKVFAVITASSLFLSSSIGVYAKSFEETSVKISDEVLELQELNYNYDVEYFMDTKKETYTYIENGNPMTVVFNTVNGQILLRVTVMLIE